MATRTSKNEPQVHLEIVIDDNRVNDVVELLESSVRSDTVDEVKIFIKLTTDVIRIRD